MPDVVIEKLKDAIGTIKNMDVSNLGMTDPLELDSIHRITLIAELENSFNIEINSENLDPEIFDNLEKLSTFLQGEAA